MAQESTDTGWPPISLREIVEAIHPRIEGDVPTDCSFRWIERDSRSIQRGDLFIAVKGERFDGHRFVEPAFKHGASAALVSGDWAETHASAAAGPLLVVPDPVEALQQVARYRRNSLPVSVVGVTGSLGKTSTKEAIAAGLQGRFRTYRSPGNMNSEIGLSLSILEIDPGTDVAILEMGGAYAAGEVDLLASIASPRVGVVTNIHPIHLERMGTIEAIADTKAELVRALPSDGFAVLNGDDHRVAAMQEQTAATVITVGCGPACQVRATDVQTHGLDGTSFQIETESERLDVACPLVGSHAHELVLAAVGVGMGMGVEPRNVIESLVEAAPQVRLKPVAGVNRSWIIDDTYNSSLPSALSALTLLSEIPAQRRIAVLGDMRELGSESDSQHESVGKHVAQVADMLITFGDMARAIAGSARFQRANDLRSMHIQSFGPDQLSDLTAVLRSELQEGDVALIKGSRGLEMERIVDALREDDHDARASS